VYCFFPFSDGTMSDLAGLGQRRGASKLPTLERGEGVLQTDGSDQALTDNCAEHFGTSLGRRRTNTHTSLFSPAQPSPTDPGQGPW